MYRKILVPLDGSEMSECSLEEAKTIALGCHVPEVTLLSVIEPTESTIPSKWGGADTVGPQQVSEIEKDKKEMVSLDKKAMSSARDYLTRVKERYSKEGVNVRTEVVTGKAAETILDYAAKNDIDLVIMSSHGRGGKSHFDFGKVADKVIRSSNIPVIVASPPGCRI